MSDVNWGMLAAYPNAGEAFQNSFEHGMQQNREYAGRNALAALVQNPNDPKALAQLAHIDPSTALNFRHQNIEYNKALLAQHQDSIIKGAQILRTFNPQNQEQYSAALAAAQQSGIDISQVPQQYNPQYVQSVIHVADALKPDAQDPGPIREFDEARNRGYLPQNTTYEQFLQMKNPGMMSPVTVPYGAQVVAGNGVGGGGQNVPKVSDQASYDAIPAGSQYQTPDGHIRVKGGAGGNASGGF